MEARKEQSDDGTEGQGRVYSCRPAAESPRQHTRLFLSPEEFAGRKGLSVTTVRRRIKDGSLPYEQLGGKRHRIVIAVDPQDVQYPQMPASPSVATGLGVAGLDGDVADRDVPPPAAPQQKLRGPAAKWTREAFSER